MTSVDAVAQKKQKVHYEVLTNIGETVHDTGGRSGTELTDGTI